MGTSVVLRVGLLPAFLFAAVVEMASASEDVPHAPFAQWADVLTEGQWQAGAFYQRSEAYHIWAGSTYHNITVRGNGEFYGIDVNQGYLTLQYGLTARWSADLEFGATTVGWRYFSPAQNVQATTGIMDTAVGARYQIWNEATADSPWTPTLTFRAGGVLPGSYNQNLAFSPGDRSAAIEPELLFRKHFGWAGLGAYGDALYRWNHTTHNDQYIVSLGLFQQIDDWELTVGYRRLGTPQGDDITLDPVTHIIVYPRYLRENSNSSEAGFVYTTPKHHLKWGFYTRSVWSGDNTSGAFWLGGYLTIPFGGK